MSNDSNNVSLELHRLLGALHEGYIKDDEFERLSFLLRDDPKCREAYLRSTDLHVKLAQLSRNKQVSQFSETSFALDGTEGTKDLEATRLDMPERSPGASAAKRWRSLRISGSAAVLLAVSACLIGVAGTVLISGLGAGSAESARNGAKSEAKPASSAIKLATIAGGVGARFEPGFSVGSRIGPGRLRLKSGVARLVFDTGAVVILQGPAELDIVDASTCRLVGGTVSARVSADSSGFQMVAGNFAIVEQDAEFGLRRTDSKPTELHVFDGELNLLDLDRREIRSTRLVRGQALRLNPDRSATDIAADPASFVSGEELERLQKLAQKRLYRQWREYSKRWLADPSVVARYEFRSTQENSFPNVAAIGRHLAVSRQSPPRCVPGRWSQKRAMLFDGRTDMLVVPDHHELRMRESFSVATWLMIRSTPNGAWSRIVGKGMGADRNYGLWLSPDGSLLWQVCPDADPQDQRAWDRCSIPSSVLPSGAWMHVVCVVDHARMKLYVNGELHASAPRPEGAAVSEDPLTIGYFGEVPGHDEHFCGEIDELILLNRPLELEEVSEMYEMGRPDFGASGDDSRENSPDHLRLNEAI